MGGLFPDVVSIIHVACPLAREIEDFAIADIAPGNATASASVCVPTPSSDKTNQPRISGTGKCDLFEDCLECMERQYARVMTRV
jgi:hypothetical protein